MIKTLVSLETSLASRLALRYACQLADLIELELHTVHIQEPEPEGSTPGAGWVRKTWEDAVLRSDRQEITRLIKAERAVYPRLGLPKIFVGDREKEIYHELQNGYYGLFVEGALHTFDTSQFYRKIHSWFYQNSPCPIVLVKNLVNLERAIILLDKDVNYAKLISTFLKCFKGINVELDLIYCNYNGRGKSAKAKGESSDTILRNAEKILSENDMPPVHCRIENDASIHLDAFVRGYGLVVSPLYRHKSKKHPQLDLLSRTPYPLFLCWQ